MALGVSDQPAAGPRRLAGGQPHAGGFAGAALWGTTGTAQSFAPLDTSPFWIGTLRMAIATLFFAAFIGWRRQRGERVALSMARPTWRWVLLAGLCMAGYNLSFFAGVRALGAEGMAGVFTGSFLAAVAGALHGADDD